MIVVLAEELRRRLRNMDQYHNQEDRKKAQPGAKPASAKRRRKRVPASCYQLCVAPINHSGKGTQDHPNPGRKTLAWPPSSLPNFSATRRTTSAPTNSSWRTTASSSPPGGGQASRRRERAAQGALVGQRDCRRAAERVVLLIEVDNEITQVCPRTLEMQHDGSE